MNILIIEDCKAEAHILGQTLERIMDEKPRIYHKTTLSDALHILEEIQDDLDLVFLDLKLTDSPEWRKTYDSIAPYSKKVPIIVMSGDDNKDTMREVLKNGAEDYIVKGSKKRHVDVLKETIDFALCRHQATRALVNEVVRDEQCIHWLSGGYSVE